MSRARFDNVLAAAVVAWWLLIVTCYNLAETHWFSAPSRADTASDSATGTQAASARPSVPLATLIAGLTP